MRKAAADAWIDCDSKLILNKAAAAIRAAIAASPAAPSVHFTEATIDEYLEDYEMTDGEGGCHTPSEGERVLIKDAIIGLLGSAAPAVREPATADQIKALVGASDEYWATSKLLIAAIFRCAEDHHGITGGGNG